MILYTHIPGYHTIFIVIYCLKYVQIRNLARREGKHFNFLFFYVGVWSNSFVPFFYFTKQYGHLKILRCVLVYGRQRVRYNLRVAYLMSRYNIKRENFVYRFINVKIVSDTWCLE